ncbi:hypothetical protein C8R44DRAFT_743844 [Mycena epipterygia]|nr:hypothetical protein C8R44DRAFT_743844 [Mycena epipterygia]
MPTKVMILAQFGHGYYIHGTLKRLVGVLAWLKAWWIHILYPWDFEVADRYYIRGSLKRPTGVLPWLKAWWICEMPAFWLGHGYYIRGTFKRLMGVLARLKAWWIRTRNPCPCCLGGEEMPAKVMILAQSGHGYYIRGTLKRLTDVVAWLKARCILMSVKRVTDQKSMPLLPRRRGNARKSHDFGSVWLWILYPWDFEEADGFFGLAHGLVDPYVVACLRAWWISLSSRLGGSVEEMPAKVMILAQFGHGYYIRGTLKRLMVVLASLKAWWIRFDHRYYIRGTLKRLMAVLASLNAWWIHTSNPCHRWLAGEEMPAKVMILAQFDHGYYICGTLQRLTDVVAWLKAWWICVTVKQVTDQKSMPLLPRWGGKVVILAQFGHRYYIRGTLK